MSADAVDTPPALTRRPGPQRRGSWPFHLILAALVVVFFGAVIFGGEVLFFRDFGLFFYPKRLLAAQAIRDGRIPFWESLSGGGVPVLGAYQSAVFYPPALIYYALPMPYSFMLFVVLHFAVTGAGAFFMLRVWGARRFAAGVGALLWTFAPAFVSIVDNVSFITSIAWLPLCLAFGKRLFERASRGAFAGLTVSLAMALLAGAPEPVMFIAASLGLLAACELVSGLLRKQPLRAAKGAGLILAGVAAAVLVAGVELVPFLEHLRYSERAARLSPRDASVWAMAPGDALLWILPRFRLYARRGGIYWPLQGWLKCVYLGAAVPVLALWTVFAVRRRRNVPFAVIAALFALLSFGGNSPLWRALYEFLPGFGLVRYPVKFFLPVAFAASVLAGFAVDDLAVLGRTKPRLGRLLFFVLAAAGVLCFVAAAGLSLWPGYAREHILPPKPMDTAFQTAGQVLDQFNSTIWSFARTGIALVAAAFAVSFAGLMLGKRALSAGIIALGCLLVADLVFLGHDLNPTAHKSIYTDPPVHAAGVDRGPGAGRVFQTQELSGLLMNVRVGNFGGIRGLVSYLMSIKGDAYGNPETVLAWASRIAAKEFPTVASLDQYLAASDNLRMTEYAQHEAYKEAFCPSTNLLYGVPLANPGEVLKVKWDAELFKALDGKGPEGEAQLEKLYAVSTVVGWTKSQFELVLSRPQNRLPRAFLVRNIRGAQTSDQALDIVCSPAFDPSNNVVLRLGNPMEEDYYPPLKGPDREAWDDLLMSSPGRVKDFGGREPSVKWLSDTGNRQVLEVNCDRSAVLCVADNFYPAIRAKVDEKHAHVFQANFAFRAVILEPGRHKVEFYFRPSAFFLGLAATAVGIAALVTTCAFLQKDYRRSPRSGPVLELKIQ